MTRPREGQTLGGASRFVRYLNFVKLPQRCSRSRSRWWARRSRAYADAGHLAHVGWIWWRSPRRASRRWGSTGSSTAQIDARNPRTPDARDAGRQAEVRAGDDRVVVAALLFVYAAGSSIRSARRCRRSRWDGCSSTATPSASRAGRTWCSARLCDRAGRRVPGGRRRVEPPRWMLLALARRGASWVAGFDILYALQDIEFDRAPGAALDPRVVGPGRVRDRVAGAPLRDGGVLAAVGTAVPAGWVYAIWRSCVAACAAAVRALAGGADDLSRLDAAFFTMNGVISVAFFVFVLAERLFALTVPARCARSSVVRSRAHRARRTLCGCFRLSTSGQPASADRVGPRISAAGQEIGHRDLEVLRTRRRRRLGRDVSVYDDLTVGPRRLRDRRERKGW